MLFFKEKKNVKFPTLRPQFYVKYYYDYKIYYKMSEATCKLFAARHLVHTHKYNVIKH